MEEKKSFKLWWKKNWRSVLDYSAIAAGAAATIGLGVIGIKMCNGAKNLDSSFDSMKLPFGNNGEEVSVTQFCALYDCCAKITAKVIEDGLYTNEQLDEIIKDVPNVDSLDGIMMN